MSRQLNVTLITCDRCGAQSAVMKQVSVNKPDEIWLRVTTDSADSLLKNRDMDFCPECSTGIINAMGLGDGEEK